MPPAPPSPTADGEASEVVDGVAVAFARPAPARWRHRLDDLDAVERERLGALQHPPTASAYATAHLLARDLVAGLTGIRPRDVSVARDCPDCGAQHGRPRLPDHPGLHLSLSRTTSLVVVAATRRGPVGVDVERVDGVAFDGFAEVALHPDERHAPDAGALGHAGRVADAVSWVRKEAALKALGVGLRVDPASVTTPRTGVPFRIVPSSPTVVVHDVATPVDGHVCALALVADVDRKADENASATGELTCRGAGSSTR
ncbi:4'-phosphopantetheinyl transferase family protein [Terracoccus luteus]|uniref:4'-phosphopantetheinyl transferase n=1 Tax=Terracoccus luteus TaxID=53356 RepID=A0A839PT70_9MICO|nr:4'-phosphopantetheinyl transferase superfamily protein [Terracoccus luteus]MBB2985186.1 4'-phosphopantetheinyl transferase [Terracoccus luteus]MCP2170838.1 4'-phosphopantetheinyl transferase [Terracoccus luteus]